MSSSPTTPSIPAVFVGVTRQIALATGTNIFKGTPYIVAAILDMSEAPDKYRYSIQTLGAVLYALHPRPQILVTGTAVDELTVAD